ncbi:ABC transporter ATP-binding protein [Paenibacillus sp.]|uniref:ABC transporter ATP-binding protein n=1 Tax=Paenibacillus sp. TaxID=58172 RepID=UPI002D3D4972|nr:ABC transporter ATP-binding protein [Paenibacillus sp.]HZG85739.1 ABC transporter ATP-binding protein [Paenibacillus sp.]
MGRKTIFREHIARHRWSYLIGFALVTVSSLLQLLIPVLMGRFTDQLEAGLLDAARIAAFALGIAAVAFGTATFRSVSRIFMFRLARVLEKRVRGDLFRHWERLPAQYYANQRVGDLMAHGVSDVGVMREVTMGAYYQVAEAVVLIGVTVGAMAFSISPLLTLLTLLPLPLLSYMAYRFHRKVLKESTDVQDAIGDMTSRVQEFIAGIRVVKAFTQERAEIDKFDRSNQWAVETSRRFVKTNSLFNGASQGIVGLSFLISVIVGGVMVLEGSITLGDFVAFNTYLTLIIGPIENVGRVMNVLQKGAASEKRLLEILNTAPEVTDGPDTNFAVTRLEGEITFRDLTFAYPGAKRPALRNVTLHVPRGSSLAIVGKVGSGKSTLVSLLVRMYNPPIGSLYVDGRDILTVPLKTLRENIGFVPQDGFLFSSTIKDNISFDPKPHTMDEVEEAARVAQVYDNIVEFPRGFDTALGERGLSLSGGQRQRVSIARAIIKQPSILVFDDSLSAVDTETEDKILAGLDRVMKGRTTIIIGHRISSVRRADQIIVLDQGRIVEQGTHDALVRLGGIYADMYHKQLMDDEARRTDSREEASQG